MERDDWLVSRALDEEAAEEEREELERRAALDPVLLDRLEEEWALQRDLSELGRMGAPFDIAAAVLRRIEREERSASTGRVRDLLRTLGARLSLPAPAWAMAALVLVAMGFLAGRATREAPAEPTLTAKAIQVAEPHTYRPPEIDAAPPARRAYVRFVFQADSARSVAVVGDFNDWDTGTTPLSRLSGTDTWTAMVPLPEGVHEYMFVVDGDRFMSDPLAARYRDDGFGNRNALIELSQADPY